MQSPSLAAITALAVLALLNNEESAVGTANAFLPTRSLNNIPTDQTHSSFSPSPLLLSRITSSLLHQSAVEEQQSTAPNGSSDSDVPILMQNGIYDLQTKEAHLALLESNPEKIVVMKFYAPWCRACKGLEPKFQKVSQDEKYENLPMIFAQMSVQNNKTYIKSLGVLALPSVHIYAGTEGLVENFPCGPSKLPILKKKIAQVVNSKVDAKTLQLKKQESDLVTETEPCAERGVQSVSKDELQPVETEIRVGNVAVNQETMNHLRTNIPFFADFNDEEFSQLMSKAKYSSFDVGSVIMRQGMVGRTFYVIDSGEVEIFVKAPLDNPLTTPSGYLGTLINRFQKGDYFGERGLITGQVRAASIRAMEVTRCFTFDIDDIPNSSVLHGNIKPSKDRLAQVNDKYGVDYLATAEEASGLIDTIGDNQLNKANEANQERGSINTQKEIRGVEFNDSMLGLLVRFKLLRNAARCFEYIKQTSPRWGDTGETYRRSLLVSKLTPAQRQEFTELFRLIDTSGDGSITVLELKTSLDTVTPNSQTSENEVKEMINKADPSVDGNTSISYDEFMGVMAEAEFYYLFKETFSTLDSNGSGYISAGKIENVLGGLRDLITDDRKSIIDVEDKDMLVDYDTFSKMMIGTY